MATSSVSSSSSTTTTTAAIDVAGIVSGLMAVENKPLINLNAKIAAQNTIISDLGTLKSKASVFQTALQSLENPNSYSSAVASSSDESVVKVTSSSGAILGSHTINVSQIAKPAQYIFNNSSFDRSAASAGFLSPTTKFYISIAGNTYSVPVDSNTTIQGLSDSINSLGIDVAANVINTTANHFGLMIQGKKTGADYGLSFTVDSGINPLNAGSTQAAQDAIFTLDNVTFNRSSNLVSDVLPGVTLNLLSGGDGSTASINLVQGSDSGPTVIQNMITAFNDLATSAKSFVQKASSDGSVPAGPLSGFSSAISFIDQIKSMLAIGATYNNLGSSAKIGLYQLGIDIQQDGTLKFNATEYANTNNIASIMASGVNFGSTSFSDKSNNLNSFLNSEIQPFGILDQSISNEQNNLSSLTQNQESLSTRLNAKQVAYTAQYSNLNALLFTLNQTSNSLTSALAGLTNGQSNR